MDLEEVEKTLRQVGIEAAGAQKLLNDEVFLGFLQVMEKNAVAASIFNADPAVREQNRVKVIVIRELWATLEVAAKLPTELREQEERAKSLE